MKPRHNTTGAQEIEQSKRSDRGRSAEKPSNIPKRGWLDVLSRTKEELGKDNLSIVAAGVAFFVFFAMIPALGAIVAIYGLVADPATIKQQVDAMSGVLPHEVVQILDQQMARIVGRASGLTWGAALGLLLALWSGAKATKAVITALNITYDEQDTRGFLHLNLIALGITLGGIVAGVIAIGLVVAIPVVLQYIHADGFGRIAVQLLRWPLLGIFAILGLAALYRYAPDRDPAKWRWVTWGAALATLLWLGASAAFSFYVSHFGSYNKTYGSLGAVAVLMLWLFISAYVVLLGAELDSELEHQTARDSTEGRRRPMGARNAYVADNLGASRANPSDE